MTEQLEFRAAQQIGVDFPNRVIELIVMPYEVETMVVDAGKAFTEVCSRGAYDGIEVRGNRVRVNRDHDVTRTCGRAVAFHPSRQEGLVAEIRIAKTELGDETLALADDEILDASAGFALLRDKDGRVVPGAEVWESRTRRRLNRLYLGHIALTPEPAYAGANVLAVRSQQPQSTSGTPNLDRIRAWKLEAEFARIGGEGLSSGQH